MNKTVDIKLNKFPTIPNNLRIKYCLTKKMAENVDISLTSLYHHYYLDNYGLIPSDPSPQNFEYLNFLTKGSDFRICPKGGLGVSSAAKRNRSFELGQAFCRMFLAQNLGIVYFAHMDKVLDKSTDRGFGGLTIKRTQKGDVPDYLCARNTTNKIFIGEAKGSYSAINFTTKKFEKWREQFTRIEVKDGKNNLLSIKGYIVGTRFVTSGNLTCKTTIYAEDPKTPGEVDINDQDQDHDLKTEIVAQHYSNISRKLQLTNLSEALDNFKTQDNDNDSYQVSVWRVTTGLLEGTKLIGKASDANICQALLDKDIYKELSFLELERYLDVSFKNLNRTYFFGMHEEVFLEMINLSKEWYWENRKPWSEGTVMDYKDSSFLEDGTVMMPFKNLEYVGTKSYS